MIKMLMVTAILHHDIMVQHILDAKFQIVFFFFLFLLQLNNPFGFVFCFLFFF